MPTVSQSPMASYICLQISNLHLTGRLPQQTLLQNYHHVIAINYIRMYQKHVLVLFLNLFNVFNNKDIIILNGFFIKVMPVFPDKFSGMQPESGLSLREYVNMIADCRAM